MSKLAQACARADETAKSRPSCPKRITPFSAFPNASGRCLFEVGGDDEDGRATCPLQGVAHLGEIRPLPHAEELHEAAATHLRVELDLAAEAGYHFADRVQVFVREAGARQAPAAPAPP